MGSPGWVRPPNPSPCRVPRRERLPSFPQPNPARATSDPRLDFQAARPSPTPQPSPTPGGAPLPGPLSYPLQTASARVSSLQEAPSLLPQVPKPLPLQAFRIGQLAPSRVCRAPDPKAQPGPLWEGLAPSCLCLWPSLSGPGWRAPQDLPPTTLSLIPSLSPLGDPLLAPVGSPSQETGSTFPGPRALLACSRSLHFQAWSPSSKQPCPWIPNTSGPHRSPQTRSGLLLSQEALASNSRPPAQSWISRPWTRRTPGLMLPVSAPPLQASLLPVPLAPPAP